MAKKMRQYMASNPCTGPAKDTYFGDDFERMYYQMLVDMEKERITEKKPVRPRTQSISDETKKIINDGPSYMVDDDRRERNGGEPHMRRKKKNPYYGRTGGSIAARKRSEMKGRKNFDKKKNRPHIISIPMGGQNKKY